jgi:hypothetical protein
MGESGVRDWVGRSRRAGRSAFDLYASKLHRPPTRPGTIRRSSLIKELADANPGPIVSVGMTSRPRWKSRTICDDIGC